VKEGDRIAPARDADEIAPVRRQGAQTIFLEVHLQANSQVSVWLRQTVLSPILRCCGSDKVRLFVLGQAMTWLERRIQSLLTEPGKMPPDHSLETEGFDGFFPDMFERVADRVGHMQEMQVRGRNHPQTGHLFE